MLLLLMSLLSTPASGDIQVIPITHASLILKWDNMVIHVDPWSRGNYEGQPQADLILVTDTHGDHLDSKQVVAVSKEDTIVVGPQAVQETISWAKVLSNGETGEFLGVKVEAMPMYNLVRGPESGGVFHEKGRGNGYLLTLGDTRVYIAGDTEAIPEMLTLEDIDVAFVPMNLPYTMTVEQAAEAVRAFGPRIVYPYHYRGSDVEEFRRLVGDRSEVRLRDWY